MDTNMLCYEEADVDDPSCSHDEVTIRDALAHFWTQKHAFDGCNTNDTTKTFVVPKEHYASITDLFIN